MKRVIQARSVSRYKKSRRPLLSLEGLERRQLLASNVLTWHNDLARTGLNNTEQVLTPSNVNSGQFGKLLNYPVSGQVQAQPLYVSDLSMPGLGTRDVVFVATQTNDLYALDANSTAGPTGGVLWHINFGPAAPTPNQYLGFRYGPYRDVTPWVGITGTPVIDFASKTMYVDAFTQDIAGQDAFSHRIHAIDITTGDHRLAPKLVQASVPGNGAGSVNGVITFAANRHIHRSAMTLLDGVLYSAYGAYADTDPYHGWVLGYDAQTLQLVSVLNTTPNADPDNPDFAEGEGGIWQSGAGLASDGSHLYAETGNGDFDVSVGAYSDSVIEMTPTSGTNINGTNLEITDYFTPYNEQQLADADADLGSAGVIVLPDQPGAHPRLLATIGKQGIIYLLDRDNFGQHNALTDNVVQKVSLGKGFWGSPAYFNQSLYYHAVNDVLKRYSLSNGLLSAAPVAQSTINYPTWPGSTPSISSNGTANGIVWEVQFETGTQVLHAYNATSLTELYNSSQNAARDKLGGGVKFISPTIADGRVFVGSNGSLSIYGLIQPVTTPPTAPNALTATPVTAGVGLAWVDNADNENGFKIERSTDGLNFAQIALVGVDSRAYTDSDVAPNTTYYYRVRATNAIGDSSYTSVANATTLPPTGAVNHYKLDANGGVSAVDSASGNNGTLVGSPLPQWVPGKVNGGSALSFSGNGVYNQSVNQSAISVTNNLAGVLGSTSTLALWVQTTQTGTATSYLAPAITGVDAPGANDIRWGTLDANGRIGLGVGDSGGVYSQSRINDGQWHHVAMTRNATTGLVQIFIDGILNASHILAAGNKTAPFSLIGALTIAAADGTRTGATYFNGKLDDIRIYSAPLGANEIAGLAKVPNAPTLLSATAMAGPVVHLTFTFGASYAESIRISRKAGVDGTFAPIALLSGGATIYDDTDVVTGTAYYYKLEAISPAGVSAASNVLGAMPPIPRVIGIHTFYNNSAYDGQNGSSNITDRTAVATDKTPLLPGHTATFANYTTYSKGLNGILIDVADMEVLPRIDDFEFTVGNSVDTSSWTQAPTPAFINTYPGRGPNGSTQITIIWNDNAIRNQWLKVQILAQPHLGMAEDVTFFFGNSVGDTGNSAADANVTATDESLVNANQGASSGVTNLYDINRDGVVNATDVSIVNANQTAGTGLQLLSFGSAPSVVSQASASPIAPAGTSTSLSVLGTDAAGEGTITYHWSAINTPPAPVTFSANNSNAAKNTVATFGKAGTYVLLVTLTNSAGTSVTSQITVQVSQTATSIAVTGVSAITVNTVTPFTAIVHDQFGNPMAVQPSFSWSVTSGSITSAGDYTSPRVAGSTTVTATASGLSGNALLSVVQDALAWYQADSGGATLTDSSTYNQPAPLSGTYGYVTGISGTALTLVGGYATLPQGVVGSFNDFTVATWVKLNSLDTWARVFDFGSGQGTYMFLTPKAANGVLRYAITTGGNGAEQYVDGPAMPINQWVHLAITQSGNTATLYVNGVAVGVNDGITLHPTNLGATTQNYIGKSQWPDPALQGTIDDFRLYSRALPADQIARLAQKSVTVVNPAAASPAPVTGTTTTLTALGADSAGTETALSYTWTVVGTPPAGVTFDRNGTNAAKSVVATFSAAGTYTFQVTIANAAGINVTSTVVVTVQQTATGVRVTPSAPTVEAGMTIRFTLGQVDQFNQPFGGGVVANPTWTLSGGTGTLSSSGVYTAPATTGSATITATAAGVPSSSATITVVNTTRAWYRANSTTGSTLTDSSGNGYTGTVPGANTWSTGVAGNAMNLVGGYGDLPDGIVNGLIDMTIATWVRVDNLANWARIFDFGTSGDAAMYLTANAGSTNSLLFSFKTAGNPAQDLTGPALAVNTWTHVAITLAGTVATMYVNGVAVATKADMTYDPAQLGNTTNNFIGESQYAADPLLSGSIDEFRIYGRALRGEEVGQLANPSIVSVTAASSNVTTNSVALTAIANDVTRGESALSYTWSVVGTPPAPVTFSTNGNNAAKSTTATFTAAGTYTFQVSVTGTASSAVTATVTVNVVQSLGIQPATPTAIAGTAVQFGLADQFGAPAPAGPVTWATSAGVISSSGLFVAPATGATSATITATVGSTVYTTTTTIIAPRGWYKADAPNATTLTDASGNNRDGTLVDGYGYSTGKIGNSLTLSGGYATLPTGIITGLTQFTIAAWVNPTSNPSWARLFDFGTSAASSMFLTTNAGGANTMRFAITTSSGAGEQQINGPALPTNTWSHVAVTLTPNASGTTYTGTLYLNGVAVATNAAMTLTPNSLGNTTINYIGKSQYTGDPTFLGSIDDFRIYGVAASASTIASLYAAGNAHASSAPSGVTATVGSAGRVNIAWTDNSSAEVGYLIERATNAGFTSGVASFVVGANQSAYADTAVTAGGTYYYRVTALLAGGTTAGPAAAGPVTTPALASVSAAVHAWTISPLRMTFTFNIDVGPNAFTAGSLTVLKTGGTTPVAAVGYSYDAVTRTATFTLPSNLPDGDYTATLVKGSSLSTDKTLTFFLLTGDINHDRSVNFNDLLVLASNFNQTGRRFDQGNLTGDTLGSVNFDDLLILAANFNRSLGASGSLTAASPLEASSLLSMMDSTSGSSTATSPNPSASRAKKRQSVVLDDLK